MKWSATGIAIAILCGLLLSAQPTADAAEPPRDNDTQNTTEARLATPVIHVASPSFALPKVVPLTAGKEGIRFPVCRPGDPTCQAESKPPFTFDTRRTIKRNDRSTADATAIVFSRTLPVACRTSPAIVLRPSTKYSPPYDCVARRPVRLCFRE